MFIYILIFGVILYFLIAERVVEGKHDIDYTEKSWSKLTTFLFIGIMGMLLFISAFRAEHIGSDHLNYVNAFHHIEEYGDAYFTEKGYVLLNKLAISIGGGTTTLTFLVSFFLIFSFSFYIKKYVQPDYCLFAALIFAFQPYLFIQSSFNIMRQGCAASIVMFSVPFLFDKKWIKYIIAIIVAATFHESALALLFLILVRKSEFTAGSFRFIAVACFIINCSGIVKLIIGLLPLYSVYGNYEASVLNFKPYVLAILIVIFYFTSIYDELYRNKNEKFFVDLFLFGLAFMILAVQNDMLYRVYIYLAFISVPGITIICKNMKNKRFIEWCFTLYYCFFYIGNVSLWYINKVYSYVPFQFFFEQ